MKSKLWILICCMVVLAGCSKSCLQGDPCNPFKHGIFETVHAQDNGPTGTQLSEPKTPPVPAPAPVVEPAPIHPGDQFLADLDAYVKLIADVQQLEKKVKATKEWKQFQDAMDRATKMQLRISQQVPRGYTWDPKSKLLVPVPRPAPVKVPHNGTLPVMPAAPVKP